MSRVIKHKGVVATVRQLIQSQPDNWWVLGAIVPHTGIDEKHVKDALSYLLNKTKEIEYRHGADGQAYHWVGGFIPQRRSPPAALPTTVVHGQVYIGLLLDDTDVILQVGDQSLRLSPEAFKQLRAKLAALG